MDPHYCVDRPHSDMNWTIEDPFDAGKRRPHRFLFVFIMSIFVCGPFQIKSNVETWKKGHHKHHFHTGRQLLIGIKWN